MQGGRDSSGSSNPRRGGVGSWRWWAWAIPTIVAVQIVFGLIPEGYDAAVAVFCLSAAGAASILLVHRWFPQAGPLPRWKVAVGVLAMLLMGTALAAVCVWANA